MQTKPRSSPGQSSPASCSSRGRRCSPWQLAPPAGTGRSLASAASGQLTPLGCQQWHRCPSGTASQTPSLPHPSQTSCPGAAGCRGLC
uniref:Uncharacterized protein n=1 Tax=Anas zonorhyncha TaxID=75864 RepID=A0A8B9ZZ55_9AVES